jgi:hypothetical protein
MSDACLKTMLVMPVTSQFQPYQTHLFQQKKMVFGRFFTGGWLTYPSEK